LHALSNQQAGDEGPLEAGDPAHLSSTVGTFVEALNPGWAQAGHMLQRRTKFDRAHPFLKWDETMDYMRTHRQPTVRADI